MTLFQSDGQAPKRRGTGLVLLLSAVVIGLLGLSLLPTPYVIERPGPVVDVLGSQDGTKVISATGAETYPTSGKLNLLTVSVVGNREQTPTWLELFTAWIDPAQAITPIDQVFPIGQTVKESEAESTAMMEQSQQDAVYVALKKLGYQIPTHIYVATVNKNAPSSGKLVAGDFIETIDGKTFSSQPELRALINKYDGVHPIVVKVTRKGQTKSFEITPKLADDGKYALGIFVGFKYDFPIDVKLALSDIGGPSGGMIFALGIYDTLTPGALTGGANIAGTGTIDYTGTVGPIGGIRQKLYAAKSAGAKYFLAPKTNCDEVIDHIPSGLQVFTVENYDQALSIVEDIAAKKDLSKLPTCKAN